jgi:MFS family permease
MTPSARTTADIGSAGLWRIVPALGIAQIIAWGSLYYSIAVLAAPMRTDLALSEPFLFGTFSASLLVSGLAAPIAGRLIDRYGGRIVLAAGSVLGALALSVIASSTGRLWFAAGWAVAGVAMAACLYDAAFSTLNQIAGMRFRQALTALTLVAGFASTVFWPLSHVLLEAVGWRQTLALYAALHLFVCLPVHLLAVPRHAARRSPSEPPAQPAPARARMPAAFFWLAAAFALATFVFSVLAVHLIGLLTSAGLSAIDAIVVASLIGPMQVAGRAAEFLFARNLRATTVGAAALGVMLAAMLCLWQVQAPSLLAFAFAVLYGCSNGIVTIVRGTVPAELFGRDAYGELLGRLARPAFIAQALAPLAFSIALTSGLSQSGGILGLALCVALALGCYVLAAAAARRPAIAAVSRPAGDG